MFASLRSDFIHIASESSIHFAGIRSWYQHLASGGPKVTVLAGAFMSGSSYRLGCPNQTKTLLMKSSEEFDCLTFCFL
jgi:hypothetical protein